MPRIYLKSAGNARAAPEPASFLAHYIENIKKRSCSVNGKMIGNEHEDARFDKNEKKVLEIAGIFVIVKGMHKWKLFIRYRSEGK